MTDYPPITFRSHSSETDTWLMPCPVCGNEQTHVDAVAITARYEDQQPNEIRVDALSGKVETWHDDEAPEMRGRQFTDGIGRRHRVALLGWCENDHEFNVIFAQHKGETFVEVSSEPNGTNKMGD